MAEIIQATGVVWDCAAAALSNLFSTTKEKILTAAIKRIIRLIVVAIHSVTGSGGELDPSLNRLTRAQTGVQASARQVIWSKHSRQGT